MDTRRDWMHLPDGGAVMAVWFTVALMMAIVANLLAAMWIVSP